MIHMTINGTIVEAEKDETLLQVAKRYNIYIPTLCYHEALETNAACRLCMVEIGMEEWGDWKGVVASCAYPVKDGLIVETDTDQIREIRRHLLELLLARCPHSAALKEIARKMGVHSTRYRIDTRDRGDLNANCILCGLCTRTCEALGIYAISIVNRGLDKEVAPPLKEAPKDCIGCLACAKMCPTGAIKFTETSTSRSIWNRTFELVKCSQCGKGFVTEEQAEYLKQKQDIDVLSNPICDTCKRNMSVKTFTSILSWEKKDGKPVTDKSE